MFPDIEKLPYLIREVKNAHREQENSLPGLDSGFHVD